MSKKINFGDPIGREREVRRPRFDTGFEKKREKTQPPMAKFPETVLEPLNVARRKKKRGGGLSHFSVESAPPTLPKNRRVELMDHFFHEIRRRALFPLFYTAFDQN